MWSWPKAYVSPASDSGNNRAWSAEELVIQGLLCQLAGLMAQEDIRVKGIRGGYYLHTSLPQNAVQGL